MENCEILKKSVLKKSDLKKGKKVTFCSTVKVFIDSCQNEDIVDFSVNCIEVNIIDKSSEDFIDTSKNDECNATDFLVHKVVYENSIEQEDDIDAEALSEEADESSILYETNAEDEGLHFVVHKVTEHEDDLIQQELDLEENMDSNFCEEIECDGDIIGRLSKLSLENILAHDKIIAFIDQNTLGLSSLLKSHINATECIPPYTESSAKDFENESTISPCLKGSELVLSPPLQELGLDKIVKAQSDNVLCEFDISPLNSILETDSDSDLSSEGTMIMMTSEESEKNEQHIKESLQKYESLKKEKVKHFLSESDENTSQILRNDNCSDAPNNNANKDAVGTHEVHHMSSDRSKELSSVNEIKSINVESENNSKPIERISSLKIYGSYMLPSNKDLKDAKSAEASITLMKNSCYWDTSLKSVEIPKDVREWKITSSPEKKVRSGSSSLKEREFLSSEGTVTDLHEKQETPLKSDELENFALASKERVQRIRKRYFEKAQKRLGGSPVRGIRPRFGSTAEIMQIVQRQSQHSLATYSNRSHVSWPCNNAISNSHSQRQRHLNEVFPSQSLPSECSSQSSSPCVFDDSNCDHNSVSSCPSIFFHERGVPEGASPPQSLSEESTESCTDNANSSIVYFSMKV